MKVRDSGMPDEAMWSSFFSAEKILDDLGIDSGLNEIVEIGCGYGTFTLPAAKRICGTVHAFDIEAEMTGLVSKKANENNIFNIKVYNRDVLEKTTGLPEDSVEFVFLFNIMHHEQNIEFLNEAYRILSPGGRVGIIHWRSDITTPRGPSLSIRPKPADILNLIIDGSFYVHKPQFIIEPYHFGIVLRKHFKT